MRTKKLPVFLEIMKSSFFIISLILIIYTIGQLITFWIFTDEYEKDLLEAKYKEISSLSKDINIEISENGFYEYLQQLTKVDDDEYIRIYSTDKIYYESPSEIWEEIKFDYVNQDIIMGSKIFDFEIYMVITGPIEIGNSQYTIQIIRENEMFQEFTENSLPILIFTLILGLALSGIGAMYVSKNFIKRLRRLTTTMNEIKEKGINKRAEISDLNDEVDIFDVSCGLNDSIQYQIDANYMKDGWRSYMAKAVKEKFGKPVISMGNYRDPQVVEDTLARGDCDLIGMGRGLIAEPNWVHKVANDQECMLRKCISCNIGCAGNRIGGNRPIRCTVNPSVLEGDTHLGRKVNKNCNVVVIGGGTAGLEAACSAAEVGCTTFLLEKKDVLGGLATEISKIPAKHRLNDFPVYLQRRAAALDNLYIFKNTEATLEVIEKFNPHIIICATGSAPLLPPIAGLHENIDKEGGKVDITLSKEAGKDRSSYWWRSDCFYHHLGCFVYRNGMFCSSDFYTYAGTGRGS